MLSYPLRRRIAAAILAHLDGELPAELREAAAIELRALAGAQRRRELMRTPLPGEARQEVAP